MLVNLEAYLRGEGGAKDEINELIKEGERQAAMNRTVTEELDTKNEDQADSTSDDAERGQT
jgi:hypothetical protein